MKKLVALLMVLCLALSAGAAFGEEETVYQGEHFTVKLPEGSWSKVDGASNIVYYYPNGDETGLSGAIMCLEQDLGAEVSEDTLSASYDLLIAGITQGISNDVADAKVESEDSTMAGRLSRYFTCSASMSGLTMSMTGNAVCFDRYILAVCYLAMTEDNPGAEYIRYISDNAVYTPDETTGSVEPAETEEPATPAVPDATGDKEILFRNLPWGTTLADTPALLGVDLTDPYDWKYWYSVEDQMFNQSGNIRHEGELGVYCSVGYSARKDMKVAGYALDDVDLYYLYIPDADGMLIRDAEHLGLYFASYKLDVKDPKAAYEDLTGKLTGLYGDPASTQHDDGYGYIVSDQLLWTGANGTLVSLVMQDYPDNNMTNLYIKYGTLSGNDMLDTAFTAAQAEESRNAEGDTDGL